MDRYVVAGNPVEHSQSPFIHAEFARQTGQALIYERVLWPLDGFRDGVRALAASGAKGCNITVPFKFEAVREAQRLTDRARLAQAANVLCFDTEGWLGDNTDGVGLVNDIERNLGATLAGKRVLLMGAGGAARGALLPFLEQHPAGLVIVNRTVAKAYALAAEVDANDGVVGCGYQDLGDQRFDIVVNATSASLKGELPPVSPGVFGDNALAYELVYGKGLTPFLRLARNAGVKRLADGVGMLVEQAAEAFTWWRGVRPDTRAMIDKLTVPLV